MQIYLEEFGTTVALPDDLSEKEIQDAIEQNIIPQLRLEKEKEREEEIQRKRDQVGILGALPRGLSRGITQTRGLIGDVLPAMVGDAFGAEEYRDRQMQEYLDRMQKMEEERPSLVPSYKDVEGVGTGLKYGLETVGQFIPSVATSIAGGGIGGFVGTVAAKSAAKKMASEAAKQYAGKKMSAKATKELAENVTKKFQKNRMIGQIGGAFAGSGVQTIPEAYSTIEQETGDPHLGTSLLVGSVNAALDSILPAAFLTRMGKTGRDEVSRNILAKMLAGGKTRKGTIAKSALKSGIVEGLTEGTQEYNQLVASRILDDNPEFFESDDFSRILDATIRGSIGGKAFGAVSGMFTETLDQRTKRELAQEDEKLGRSIESIQQRSKPPEPVQYKIVDSKGKEVKVDPFEDIEQAKKYIQSQKRPQNFTVVDQKGDKVFTGYEEEQLGLGLDERTSVKEVEGETEAERATNHLLTGLKTFSLGPAKQRKTRKVKDTDPNSPTFGKMILEGEGRKIGKKEFDKAGELEEDVIETTDAPQTLNDNQKKVYKASVKYIQDRLDVIANKGAQGKKIADGLRELIYRPKAVGQLDIDPQSLTVGEVTTAFRVGEIMSDILPEQSDHALKFLQTIVTPEGKVAQGRRDGHSKVVELAFKSFVTESGELAFDKNTLERTASHEAFHILQDYFIKYDPKSKKILDQEFGSTERSGELIDYSKTKTAKWIKRYDKDLHDKLIDYSIKSGGITGREIQAHAFGVYNQARLEGKTPIMAGGMQRYFKFLTDFLTRLGNSLRGLGFQTAEDVFKATSEGVAAEGFGTKTLEEKTADPSGRANEDWSSMYPGRFLTREGGQPYPADTRREGQILKINNGSPVIAKIQPDKKKSKKNVVMKQGAYYFDNKVKRMDGYGYDAIGRDENIEEIKRNTPHNNLVHFIQDVVTKGKMKPIGFNRYQYTYKPPEYKQLAKVVVDEDQNGNLSVMEASADDTQRIQADIKQRQQQNAEYQKRRMAQDQTRGASDEDIRAYREKRDRGEYSAVDTISKSRKEAPSVFGEGASQVDFIDQETGSRLSVIERRNRTSSVIDLFVPEEHRGKGIGFKLQQQAINDIPDLMGQVSSKAAAVNAYRLGRRPAVNPNATLEETLALIDQESSVNMLSPVALEKRMDSDFSTFGEEEVNPGKSVSTRFPTIKSRDGDPLTEFLKIDSTSIRETPEALAKAARQIKEYNILQIDETKGLTDNQVVDLYIERMADNLLFIYDGVPENTRNRSRLWYVGANKIANKFAEKHGISVEQASGILAALSPQKDWFQNASLGERLIDIMSTKQDTQFTPEMMKTAKRIFGKEKYKKALDFISNPQRNDTSLGSLELYHPHYKAMWLRIYDETYNDRGHRIVSPEGEFLDFARKKPKKGQAVGDKKGTGWGSLTEISKAITIFEDASIETISKEMGLMHKIRSFYNNIANPFDENGSATIDTHAIAAAFLQPFAGKSIPVSHNFGVMATKGVEGSAAVGKFGTKGYYGLNYEAYKLAAERRGVLPREMQSITWEAVRGLFPAEFKTKENVKNIEEIWNKFQKGDITLDEARQEVVNYANTRTKGEGFGTPDWARPNTGMDEIRGDTTYEGKLPRDSVPRRGRDDSRTGGDPARRDQGDPFLDAEYSAIDIFTPDQIRSIAKAKKFKRLHKGQFIKSGFGNSTILQKLFLNRTKLEEGEPVVVRPNLNGWIFEEGKPPFLTQTVHTRKGKGTVQDPYGTPIGYDHIVPLTDGSLHVNQKTRASIALNEADKSPMAGVIGNNIKLTDAEMAEIIQNPDHVLNFNPKTMHLFTDEDGFAVKEISGRSVNYNTKVYVQGDIEYWAESQAPKPERNVPSNVKYIDTTAKMGINVRTDTEQNIPYADLIVDGEKTFETRTSYSLDPYINKTMSIVKTGEGKAKAIGKVKVGEPIRVNEAEFRKLEAQHKVPQGSKFDIEPNGTKILYPLTNPVRYEYPKQVGKGIVAREVTNEDADWSEFSETIPVREALPWNEIIVSKDEGLINSFLQGLKKTFATKDFFVFEFINSAETLGMAEEIASLKKTGVKKRMNVAEGAQRFYEMVMNTAGRIEIIMKKGAPQLTDDGLDITIRNDTKGIFEMFEDFTMPEYQSFTKYAVARRARALGEKENLIPEANIQEGLALETQKFKTAFDEYQKYNKGLLSFLVETGVIDERQKENLSKYDYIPFYRIIEEESYKGGVMFKSDVLGPQVASVFNNPDAGIMKYRGGKEPIGDLLENVFRNTQAFVAAGLKNVAMKKAVKVLKEAEIGRELTRQEANQASRDLKRKVIQYNETATSKEGKPYTKKVYYDVTDDPHIYATLAAMNPRQTAGLFKLMERIGKIFREGITHAPPFMIANLIRGEMAALVTVDAPLSPVLDTVKGLRNSLNESETVQEMKLLSGVGGYAMGDDYRDSAEAIKRQMRIRHRGYKIIDSPQAVVDLMSAGWGKLTKLGEATELATREGVYRKLVAQGMSKADAAYEALNVINFNRRGAATTNLGLFMNSLMPLVPFLNARFQGLYRTFEPMVSGKQANRKNTLFKGLMLMGANMALYSLMSQDDRWRDEPMHRKLGYHIIYPNVIGLEDVLGDNPILIPRAFEVGAIFTSIPELFMDFISGREGGEYVADGLKHTFINTFQFNPIPQALIPAIEVISNYDFFTGRQIDTTSQMRYLPSERVGPMTPEAARQLSKASGETLSPNQISQLLEGYLGTLGGYMLNAVDIFASEMNLIPERPTGVFGSSIPAKVAEAMGFGRFRRPSPDPSSRWIGEFYELHGEVAEVYATVQKLRREGRIEQANDLFQKNTKLLKHRPQLNAINTVLQNINRQITRVRVDDKLSGDEKTKRLNVLTTRRKQQAKRVDKILNRIAKES